jgi:hypothetical protein
MAYELYMGDEMPAQQVDRAMYYNSSDAVYGWQPQACTTSLQYVCEMPPSAFACYPPPMPPTPPPHPPSPPSPPIASICECRCNPLGLHERNGMLLLAFPIELTCTSCNVIASPAGAPAATRNIFCDPSTDTCFNLTTTVRSFDDATSACAAMTGQLVTYTSAAKQLMVEQVGWVLGQLQPAVVPCI